MNGNTLPCFDDPPLQEVAISVQFEPLQRLVVPEIGRLWQHYEKKGYQHVEQHPPIEPAIERLGVRKRFMHRAELRLVDGPMLPRVWFLSDDKRELIQIQQDRFGRNWRKVEEGDDYPRYDDHIRGEFLGDFEDFLGFVTDSGIGAVAPTQCEVTYVNLIVGGDGWKTHADCGEVFTPLSRDYTVASRYEIEDVRFATRHLIRAQEGEFLGRLHTTMQPVFVGPEEKPGFNLTLVARGRPLSAELDGIMGFIDLGREHIVRAFADVTRDSMHRIWRRIDR